MTHFAKDHWNNPAKGAEIRQRWDRFWEVFKRGAWEPETKALLAEILKPGDLFLDVGAWIGPVSLWALEMGCEVIAIEPDPVALPELHRRVPASVEVWECALGLEAGTARLGMASAYGDSMSCVTSDKGGIPVPIKTLDEILQGRRPALANIDIEGYEMTLLPALAPRFAELGCALVISLHTGVPPREWFAGFSKVSIPSTPRRGGKHGRSRLLVARP